MSWRGFTLFPQLRLYCYGGALSSSSSSSSQQQSHHHLQSSSSPLLDLHSSSRINLAFLANPVLFVAQRHAAAAAAEPTMNDDGTTGAARQRRASKPLPKADLASNCPFRCLGLTKDAKKEEVRENYLQLALVHHPDKAGGDAQRFRRINEAQKECNRMIESGYAAKTATYESHQTRNKNGTTTTATSSTYYSSYTSSSFHQEQQRKKAEEEQQQQNQQQQQQQTYYSQHRNQEYNSNNYTNQQYGTEQQQQHQARQEEQQPHYQSSWTPEEKARHRESIREAHRAARRREEAYRREQQARNMEGGEGEDAGEHSHRSGAGGGSRGENSQFSDRDWWHEQAKKDQEDLKKAFEEAFGDEEWQRLREQFMRAQRTHASPAEIFRVKFQEATTVEEIDALYNEAVYHSKIFEGFDSGRPLFFALERYHLELGLGMKHIEKCISMMDDWEKHYGRVCESLYYQLLLGLYTGDTLLIFPQLESSEATECVWKLLERMQEHGVVDESGCCWWESLRLCIARRGRSRRPTGKKAGGEQHRDDEDES